MMLERAKDWILKVYGDSPRPYVVLLRRDLYAKLWLDVAWDWPGHKPPTSAVCVGNVVFFPK